MKVINMFGLLNLLRSACHYLGAQPSLPAISTDWTLHDALRCIAADEQAGARQPIPAFHAVCPERECVPESKSGPGQCPSESDDELNYRLDEAYGKSSRILVADDNVVFAQGLTRLLSNRRYDVRTAFDGRAALKVAEDFHPGFMLLDIDMPEMTGYEAAQAIRSSWWGRDAVLIALTGRVQKLDKQLAALAGFDHHFSKPVDLLALERVLDPQAGTRNLA